MNITMRNSDIIDENRKTEQGQIMLLMYIGKRYILLKNILIKLDSLFYVRHFKDFVLKIVS